MARSSGDDDAIGILNGMPDQVPSSCGCPNTFSAKEADDDLRRYLQRGADSTTRALIDAIVAEGVQGATLLDIGGGIGAIQLELLGKGAASTVAIDATEAYVAVARAEAERRGFGDRTTARVGDFADLAEEIEPADIVTLDRVLCCDPDLPGLLGRAAERARRMVGLVYPREVWWNRIGAAGIAAFGWLTRDRTRMYVHRVRQIDAILRSAGFERRDIDRTLVWQVALYVRR
jgi:SAM-dependent methyltransferase